MGSFCLRWAPTLCGLATVPLLPLFFDAPLERAAEYVADSVWPISYDAHKKLAATAGSAHHHHHHH